MTLQELLTNAPFIWFIIGIAFALLELAIPGLIMIFFAFGAFVVSLLGVFIDFNVTIQILIFVAVSISSLVLFRRKLKSRFFQKKTDTISDDDEFIGHQAVVMKKITPLSNGKIEFKGTLWTAKSDADIEKGITVEIIGKESIKLIVKPLNH